MMCAVSEPSAPTAVAVGRLSREITGEAKENDFYHLLWFLR